MGQGYEYPAPIRLAPGQLVTLFVAGIPRAPRLRAPAGEDLPASLRDISVHMSQLLRSLELANLQLPLLEVRPVATCFSTVFSQCFTPAAAITVQVPFEIEEKRPHICTSCRVTDPNLIVSLGGQSAYQTDAEALPDQVHFLRAFDTLVPAGEPLAQGLCYRNATNDNYAPSNLTALPCPAIVKHADGSQVTAANPAKPGEELLAIATGLGRTYPESETGKVVKKSVPTYPVFSMDFNYRPNALATRPSPEFVKGVPKPVYTGTLEGAVGLYEVRFIVPPVPPDTPPCASLKNLPASPRENVVYSNLTFSLGGYFSFDGAGICVAVAEKVDEK